MRQADVFCVALGGASERKRPMVHRVHMLPQAFNRTVQGSAHYAHGETHGVDIAVQSVCIAGCMLSIVQCGIPASGTLRAGPSTCSGYRVATSS